jgi:DNA-binding Lrp family transcriptional regulator
MAASKKPLTLLAYVVRHIEEFGYQPTLSQLAEMLKTSEDEVIRILRDLEEAGTIEILPPEHRAVGIRIIRIRFTHKVIKKTADC